MNITMYCTLRSPYARKVRIILMEKSLSYNLKEIDLFNKPNSFLNLSPIGKVPVLIDENGTVIWDSTLIVEYLDEKYPTPRFYPHASQEYLRCRKWEEIGDSLSDNAVALWLQKRKAETPDARDQARYQAAIQRLLYCISEQLAISPYLLGEVWTAADVAVLVGLSYYSFRVDQGWQEKYPLLSKWVELLHERESVRLTIPQT